MNWSAFFLQGEKKNKLQIVQAHQTGTGYIDILEKSILID